ncbi:histidinol-phosphatase HisJ family protein [Clostridium sp. YIM B02505]|uniref:Histidinol-phosphatase n=1 Tax=Clostridium yunnanense TaxID=2800325 RepID=A0ABS1EKB7_9CLOT|nr:histidinol-phosphatase HisJ family protein [Clostridium yunnanense]MBK1809807.1 histidinol-phosphatase HisJ family protein [Clostridium yunnanense]
MNNLKADCHIHSSVSPDSNTPLREICESACENGIQTIIVTNHLEYYIDEDGKNGSMDISYVENSLEEIEKCRVEFQERLEILFGMEMGQMHYWTKDVKKNIKGYKFDYLLGSIHKLGNLDLKNGDYSEENREKQNEKYLNSLYEMVVSCDFDCVGHFDLVKRYGANHNVEIKLMKQHEEKVRDILKEVIKRGKGIEINTSGMRQLCKESMPSFDILKLYKELGGTIITLGSDAHRSEDVGAGFDEIIIGLKEIGINQLAVYRERRPYFYDI